MSRIDANPIIVPSMSDTVSTESVSVSSDASFQDIFNRTKSYLSMTGRRDASSASDATGTTANGSSLWSFNSRTSDRDDSQMRESSASTRYKTQNDSSDPAGSTACASQSVSTKKTTSSKKDASSAGKTSDKASDATATDSNDAASSDKETETTDITNQTGEETVDHTVEDDKATLDDLADAETLVAQLLVSGTPASPPPLTEPISVTTQDATMNMTSEPNAALNATAALGIPNGQSSLPAPGDGLLETASQASQTTETPAPVATIEANPIVATDAAAANTTSDPSAVIPIESTTDTSSTDTTTDAVTQTEVAAAPSKAPANPEQAPDAAVDETTLAATTEQPSETDSTTPSSKHNDKKSERAATDAKTDGAASTNAAQNGTTTNAAIAAASSDSVDDSLNASGTKSAEKNVAVTSKTTAVDAVTGASSRNDASTTSKSDNASRSQTTASADDAGTTFDRTRFMQRVESAFEAMGNRGGTLRLKLSPPELGSLKLEISVRNGQMKASIEAETPEAQNALMQNLPDLRERLAQQDIKIQQFDVTLRNGAGDNAQQNAAFSDGGRQQGNNYRSTSHSYTETTSLSSGTPAATQPIADGHLNVII